MSGSISDPLTDSERTDIRRFMGYPVFGVGNQSTDIRLFTVVYATLEFRLTNLTPAEQIVCRAFIVDLNAAEASIRAARSTLNVDTAAVFIRNKREMVERHNADYGWQRRELCAFLGLPPGPGLCANTGLSFIV